MNATRAHLITFIADALVAVGAAAVWLYGAITLRRVGIGLVAAAVIAIGTLAAIWLTAAALGYFLSPSGCAWIIGIGPCS